MHSHLKAFFFGPCGGFPPFEVFESISQHWFSCRVPSHCCCRNSRGHDGNEFLHKDNEPFCRLSVCAGFRNVLFVQKSPRSAAPHARSGATQTVCRSGARRRLRCAEAACQLLEYSAAIVEISPLLSAWQTTKTFPARFVPTLAAGYKTMTLSSAHLACSRQHFHKKQREKSALRAQPTVQERISHSGLTCKREFACGENVLFFTSFLTLNSITWKLFFYYIGTIISYIFKDNRLILFFFLSST